MNSTRMLIGRRCLAIALAVALTCFATTRADELPLLAGKWKVTFQNGSVNVYTVDRHGRVEGIVNGTQVTGRAVKQNDDWTQFTFTGNDTLERIRLSDGDNFTLGHWDHKADYPAKNAAGVGYGVRQQPTPPATDAEPNVKVRDLAGQWTVIYGDDPYGPIHLYTFDKQGRLRGRECGPDVQLTGQIERRDGALLLTFNEVDKLEQFTLRVDGHLAVEHWAPKSGYGTKKPDWVGVGTPVSGSSASGIESVDQRMIDCLNKIGCSGATFAVGRGGRIYFTRGYGWSDCEHSVPILPDTPMQLGSCCKPITAAIVRQIASDKKIPLAATVLPMFRVKPAGQVVDKRVWDITLQNVIDHKAGWQGDPIAKASQAYNGGKYPVIVEDILPYVAVQHLAFAPGTKSEYDNFGYGVLARVAVKLSGKRWTEYLRHDLLRRYGIQELNWVRDNGPRRPGEPPQLWNGLIMEDQSEYRSAESIPAICTFMSYFWIDGSPRDNSHPLWIHTGSWDNCTSATVWRSDGINVAWAFNGRNNVDPGESLWKDAIDWLLAAKKIPSR